MANAELIKTIKKLEIQVNQILGENTKVLEADQQTQNTLLLHLRCEDDEIRNLKEKFNEAVQTLRQDFSKASNEFRQKLHDLREAWAETLLFEDKAKPTPVVEPSRNDS